MQSLTLYTPYTHTPCGMIDAFESVEITHKSIEEGEIRFTCRMDATGRMLKKDMLIWPQGDNTAYIATTVEKSRDKWGKETVNVRGSCLKWLLKKRVFELSKVYKGTVGAVMAQCFNAVTTGSRAFPRFTVEIDAELGEEIMVETGQDDLKTVLEDICEAEGLRMWVSFDPATREMVLKAESGVDRSREGEASTVMIDTAYEVISNVTHTQSVEDYANVMYIADSDNVVIEEGATDKTGYERYEAVMTASTGKKVTNVDGSTTNLTTAQYTEKKKQEAKTELEKLAEVESVDGDMDAQNKLLTFGKDFEIGDIVTARVKEWGVEARVRVREEHTKYQKGTAVQNVTLGNPLPTLASRIQRIQKKARK